MSAETIENIADLLWNADFLLVVAGSGFQGNNKSPFLSGYCDSSLICNTRKFVGFWGTHYNDCLERNPHDGYKIISKWKHQYFSNCDDRKRKVGKSNNKEEENNPATPRLMVLTNSCDNAFQKCDLTDDEVYDIWGNITFFQCSRNPPCNNKIWKADNSSFRFLIDPATMEAPPIRYESDKKGNKSSIISCLRDLDADLHGGFLPFKEINVTESFESATKSKKMVVPQSHTSVKSVTTRSRSKISYSFSDRATCMYLHKDISPPIACKYMDLFDLPAANMTNKDNATQELETDTNQDENSDIFSANEHLGISHFFHHFNVLWTKHNVYAGGNYRLFETEVFRNEWLNYCRSVNRHYDSSPTVSSRSRRTQVCFNVSIAVRDDAQEPGEMETFEIKHIHHKKFFPSDPFCWSQGSDGFFYFRGLSAEATYQEPINGGECDELVIPLKERSHHLPLKCTISVICETKQVPSGEVPMKQAFTSDHVWQMVGKCDLEKEDIFTLAQEQGIASAKNTRKNRAFELVLLSCSYYHVQLGIELQCGVEQPSGLAGSCVCLSYVRLFVPCKGAVDVLSPFEEQTIEISSLLDPKPEYAMFPPMNMSAIKEISLRPVPNYLVCKQCHDVARPFVLMTGNGKKKDEGILQCVLNAKQKLFKTWENDIIQVLKNDPSRQVVILELGCDMKGDPCRALGEKFYKGVKSFKSTLIRIASHLFETKSNNADASNLITVEGEIIPVLTKIEKILQAKRRD